MKKKTQNATDTLLDFLVAGHKIEEAADLSGISREDAKRTFLDTFFQNRLADACRAAAFRYLEEEQVIPYIQAEQFLEDAMAGKITDTDKKLPARITAAKAILAERREIMLAE